MLSAFLDLPWRVWEPAILLSLLPLQHLLLSLLSGKSVAFFKSPFCCYKPLDLARITCSAMLCLLEESISKVPNLEQLKDT